MKALRVCKQRPMTCRLSITYQLISSWQHPTQRANAIKLSSKRLTRYSQMHIGTHGVFVILPSTHNHRLGLQRCIDSISKSFSVPIKCALFLLDFKFSSCVRLSLTSVVVYQYRQLLSWPHQNLFTSLSLDHTKSREKNS